MIPALKSGERSFGASATGSLSVRLARRREPILRAS